MLPGGGGPALAGATGGGGGGGGCAGIGEGMGRGGATTSGTAAFALRLRVSLLLSDLVEAFRALEKKNEGILSWSNASRPKSVGSQASASLQVSG